MTRLRVIYRLVEAGKGREAAKLRSYIRAAYAAALRADGDPTIPRALQAFNLSHNPAQDLAALSQFNQIRDTTLTLPELRALWNRLEEHEGPTGAALRLCILMGGQRPSQLVRLLSSDVDFHGGKITIYDPKGRRSQPRAHILPITPVIETELYPWVASHPNGYALSSTGGEIPLRLETLSTAFKKITRAMRDAGKLGKDFRLADIRRTVETLLAGEGISMETRAQLQSHGLSGIQNRHYDRHSYMNEKQLALTTLQKLLMTQ